jgi:hypothetical protein
MHLLKVSESRRKNESTDGITISVRAMRVKFTACVTFGNVEARQVAST